MGSFPDVVEPKDSGIPTSISIIPVLSAMIDEDIISWRRWPILKHLWINRWIILELGLLDIRGNIRI